MDQNLTNQKPTETSFTAAKLAATYAWRAICADETDNTYRQVVEATGVKFGEYLAWAGCRAA